MRIINNVIHCSPQMMAHALSLLTSGENFDHLVPSEANPTPHTGQCYMFRAGAKLCRDEKKPNLWYIHGYCQDKSDRDSAWMELRAAYHMHRAVSLLLRNQELLQVPQQFRVQYRGMWATYSDGQRSPSALNYGTHIAAG